MITGSEQYKNAALHLTYIIPTSRIFYQNAHQPEKHWQRFSRAVAESMSFSTWSRIDKVISGLKSRPMVVESASSWHRNSRKNGPVSLCWTRWKTKSARSLRISWAPGSPWVSTGVKKVSVNVFWTESRSVPLKISFSFALSFRWGPWGCAATRASSAARSGSTVRYWSDRLAGDKKFLHLHCVGLQLRSASIANWSKDRIRTPPGQPEGNLYYPAVLSW